MIIHGNNIDILKSYPDNYFDSVVTDPPYGLGKEPDAVNLMKDWVENGYHEINGVGFMGKEWDAFVPQPIFWKEVFRVLKHGGYVVAFYGTRTYDWGVMAMRVAGFEVRDCIQWLYGSGFPKSHNVSKAIDKMNSVEREVIKQWDGWGSALKPAHEDLVLARKPFKFSSDFIYLYESIVYNIKQQICQSKLFAKDVKVIFTLSQKDLKGVELDFAQWSVGKPFNTKEDLLVLMDMLQLEMKEGNTTLNIVLLWLNTLVELWNVANTYTTETESSTITELRILNSLEWESIFQNITLLKENKTNGFIANVLTVESLFSVLNLKLNDILTHSAKENVTLKESEKNFVPNSEPIVLARKPLEKGLSIAENVLKWGTGAINIDGCRVGFKNEADYKESTQKNQHEKFGTKPITNNSVYGDYSMVKPKNYQPNGRFPANLILTHSSGCVLKGLKNVGSGKEGGYNYEGNTYEVEGFVPNNSPNANSNYGIETVEHWECVEDCPIRIMDEQSGISKSSDTKRNRNTLGSFGMPNDETPEYSDKGGASRFFYIAKASKSERNRGLDGFEEKKPQHDFGTDFGESRKIRIHTPTKNFHPTVKPVKLMQYLVRLVTPQNGIVLDPFCGSGTTGIACKLEGFQFIGMEQDQDYCKIAEARIINYTEEPEEQLEIIEEKKEKKIVQLDLF